MWPGYIVAVNSDIMGWHPMLQPKYSLLFVILFLCSYSQVALSRSNKHTFAAGLTVGPPQLASLELAFQISRFFTIGVAVGTLPINEIVNQNVPLSPVSVDLGLSEPHSIVPTASYRFTTTSAFLRIFPWGPKDGSGVFLDLNYARWKFTASVSGNLENDSSESVLGNAISGSLTFSQPVASASIGYRFSLFSSLFAQIGAGVGYLLDSELSTSIGGTITTILPLAGESAVAEFETVKADVDTQVKDGINSAKDVTKLIPSIFLTLAWGF